MVFRRGKCAHKGLSARSVLLWFSRCALSSFYANSKYRSSSHVVTAFWKRFHSQRRVAE